MNQQKKNPKPALRIPSPSMVHGTSWDKGRAIDFVISAEGAREAGIFDTAGPSLGYVPNAAGARRGLSVA